MCTIDYLSVFLIQLFKYHSVFRTYFRGIIFFYLIFFLFPFFYLAILLLLGCKEGAHSFHITALDIYMTKVNVQLYKKVILLAFVTVKYDLVYGQLFHQQPFIEHTQKRQQHMSLEIQVLIYICLNSFFITWKFRSLSIFA